jgi:hypothetical protein
MMDLRLVRLACRLRLVDVWAGTGISTARLSAFERGRAKLSESEERLLISYLRDRWTTLQSSASAESQGDVEGPEVGLRMVTA